LPSTTLAQCDAGVGVKNGVNAFGTKNTLGCYAVPWAVINDAHLLTSLSDRDWRAGLAEMVKVALLKDASYFRLLESASGAVAARNIHAMSRLIHRSAELHVQHIAASGDPFEIDEARPLDFGHWSAHRLEELTAFRLNHGEAVAAGVALDCVLSETIAGLPHADVTRILSCLSRLGLPIYAAEMADLDGLLAGLEEFREHLGGDLRITLLRRVGSPTTVKRIDAGEVEKAVDLLSIASQRQVRATA